MRVIYRISDSGYNKVKPAYINNEACLKNAIQTFPWFEHNWTILADNISEETNNMIQKHIPRNYIEYVSVGHGAGTFNLALDEALGYDDEEELDEEELNEEELDEAELDEEELD